MNLWQTLLVAGITGIAAMLAWFVRRGINRNDANHERSQTAIQTLVIEVKGLAVSIEKGYVTSGMLDVRINSTRDEIYSHMDTVESRLADSQKALSEKLDRHLEKG